METGYLQTSHGAPISNIHTDHHSSATFTESNYHIWNTYPLSISSTTTSILAQPQPIRVTPSVKPTDLPNGTDSVPEDAGLVAADADDAVESI